jgi:hypothetical protein
MMLYLKVETYSTSKRSQNFSDLDSQKADASQKSDQYESEKEKELDIKRG